MKFDLNDYNENVEYCKYVFDKNNELDLGLEDARDIQIVANYYVDELIELEDGHILEELIENDLLLVQVIKEYLSKIKVKALDQESLYYSPKQADELQLYSYNERMRNTHGGYGMSETYDDLGLDEINYDDEMKL